MGRLIDDVSAEDVGQQVRALAERVETLTALVPKLIASFERLAKQAEKSDSVPAASFERLAKQVGTLTTDVHELDLDVDELIGLFEEDDDEFDEEPPHRRQKTRAEVAAGDQSPLRFTD